MASTERMTNKKSIILLTLAIASCFSAKPRKQMQLFYRPPGTTVEIYREEPVSLGINVYPPPPGPIRGAVIFVHGGGWMMPGTDLPLFEDWEQPLKDAGLQAFSIEHRTAPEYRGRELVEDCAQAVRYVHQNAARFKIPEDKIALIGFSSGGHLSVMTALTLTKQDPALGVRQASYLKAVVSFYAPLDLEELAKTGGPEIRTILANYLPIKNPGEEGDESKQRAMRMRSMADFSQDSFLKRTLYDISPIENIHPAMAPTFLIHGDSDSLIPMMQSVQFYRRAYAAGASVAFLGVPGAEHNFQQSRKPYARQAEAAAIQFILQHLQ